MISERGECVCACSLEFCVIFSLIYSCHAYSCHIKSPGQKHSAAKVKTILCVNLMTIGDEISSHSSLLCPVRATLAMLTMEVTLKKIAIRM